MTEEEIIQEIRQIIEKTGEFPTYDYLNETGNQKLNNAIRHSGKVSKYRKIFNMEYIPRGNRNCTIIP